MELSPYMSLLYITSSHKNNPFTLLRISLFFFQDAERKLQDNYSCYSTFPYTFIISIHFIKDSYRNLRSSFYLIAYTGTFSAFQVKGNP